MISIISSSSRMFISIPQCQLENQRSRHAANYYHPVPTRAISNK